MTEYNVTTTQIGKRLKNLEEHLAEESPDNPILPKVVQSFRKLDQIAYKLGILGTDQSYATRVSWWPMIAVLGTFSAGKSTFINYYLDIDIQRTGNQAVDDKFTVICFNNQEGVKTLPGVALDADPRFPFYQVSRYIEEISTSGAQRIDTYLQLKTCASENVRGKILIDSPGFDADKQRDSTLQLTDHIVDLADLVLVFFDARHPEPGAMEDTLDHLVKKAIDRADSNKFLYILNQVDITAREDNPEEVIAAWQRALASRQLTSGRFYRIYNPKVCIDIQDPKVKERFETKRDADLAEIKDRMSQVETDRAYRIVGTLEQTAKYVQARFVPRISGLIDRWKKRILITNALVWGGFTLLLLLAVSMTGTAGDLMNLLASAFSNEILMPMLLGLLVVGFGFVHLKIKKHAANAIIAKLEQEITDEDTREQIIRAFRKNTPWWRPCFMGTPLGWNHRTQEQVHNLLDEANEYIQELNNKYVTIKNNPKN